MKSAAFGATPTSSTIVRSGSKPMKRPSLTRGTWAMAALNRAALATLAGLSICASGKVGAQQPSAPATWVLHGDPHTETRLAWSTPGLKDFLNYGYVVCNADRTHAIVLRYKFNSINQKKVEPRECFGVDSPTRLDLTTEKGETLKIRGVYQTYRWGSFRKGKLDGVTFPLAEDGAINPPVKGARVHGLSSLREESARCDIVPANWEAAQDFVAYCKLPLPTRRLANYRLCFPEDALGDTLGAAGGAMAVIISEILLKERSALFHSIIVPGSCIDLHEQSQAWVLVSKKGAEGFDPTNVSAVKVQVKTIAK